MQVVPYIRPVTIGRPQAVATETDQSFPRTAVPMGTAADEQAADPAAPGPGTHATTQPIYGGSVRVINYNTGARSGRTGVLQLLDLADTQIHPFKGLRWSRSRSAAFDARGHRLHIVISLPAGEDGAEDTTLYVGEGILNWWSDDCANGMRVTLRFDGGPEGADWHPLYGQDADPKTGAILYLACWAVDDDETVQDPRQARRSSRPFSSLTAVHQSQIKCRKDGQFQEWCATEFRTLLPNHPGLSLPDAAENPVAFAESVVRAYCGVETRAVFSQDTAEGFRGRQAWQEMMRLYEDWRRIRSLSEHPAFASIPYGN